MGNKHGKGRTSHKNKDKKEEDEEDEEFFDDNLPSKKKPKNDSSGLEHNVLISQIKTDPSVDYTIIKERSGSFATVHLVRHKTSGQIRAMKAIKKGAGFDDEEDNEEEIINEINILMKMDHPNIVKIFEFYNSPTHYYLITEYCEGGCLFDLIVANKGPFTEIQASYIMHQLFSVVNYCHKMKIIHRDLKPENILVNKNENGFVKIKICDFDTSLCFKRGEIQDKIVGSIYYIAPEVLKKKYNSKCDLWSCGVIMYILLTSVPPFGGTNNQVIIKKILDGKYDKTKLSKRCKACIDLIDKLLEKDIRKRIGADAALRHKWFQIYKSKEIRVDIEDPKIIEAYLRNLKNYKKSSEIQEIALAYLVHNHPELEEVDNACKLFGLIDKKGNGKITREEFYNGLSPLYKNEKLKDDIDKIFENLDTDGSKYLECEEFVRAAIDKSIFLTDDSMKFAFNYFDKDGKGEITSEDLLSIFSGDVKNSSELEKIKKMIKNASSSNDEKIRFKEFCDIMKTFIANQ